MSPVTTDRVREILAAAEVDGLHVRLAWQLDRKEYVQVAKVLEAIGGKWDRRARAHVFTTDPAAALADFVAGGSAPKPARSTEGYVATPDRIADTVIAAHTTIPDLTAGSTVLEPSAGDGALVRAIRRRRGTAIHVVAVEPNPHRATQITGADTVAVDTLERFAETDVGPFDAVLMNPPFALPGQATAWIDHVRMAWDLLGPGGRLVAIAPSGFVHRQDRRHVAIRDLVKHHGGWAHLPDNAFVSSGTAVRTVSIWMDKAPRSAA